MTWIFIKDLAFYALLGFMTFVPIVTLVASILRGSFAEAREVTKEFLKTWAAIAPTDFLDKVFNVAGISTVMFLLAFLAYGFNRLGDAAMPLTSKVVSHFGSAKVRWSIEHKDDDWHDVKFEFREVTGIKGDRLKWEEAKTQLGKYDVRLFRTSFFLFLVVMVAAFIDLIGIKKWKRGLGLLLVALLGITASQWLWVERQDNYIVNVVSRYESEYLNQYKEMPKLPSSYPKN